MQPGVLELPIICSLSTEGYPSYQGVSVVAAQEHFARVAHAAGYYGMTAHGEFCAVGGTVQLQLYL